VAEDGGRLVSHLGLVPVTYASDGQSLRGAIAVDAMTSPDARGKGWFSRVVKQAMESTRDDYDIATAYQIRDAVLGAMLRGGWAVAEKVPVLVRPAGIRLSRKRDQAVRELTRDDIDWMSRIAATPGFHMARTADFLAWRFFDNPHWKYRVTASGDGYLVARRTKLKGFDTYAIVDAAGDTSRLVADAIDEAKALRCTLVAALVSRQHPLFGRLLRRGFVPGPHRFRLLVHPQPRRAAVTWADTDHL